MSLVSVIVLNWDASKWLPQCIYSLNKQTYFPIEVLAINQKSEDGSLEVLKKLEELGGLILLGTLEDSGFSSANNYGITEALSRGSQYILLFNTDTKMFPDGVETMVKCLQSNEKYGICGLPAYEYNNNNRIPGIGGWIRRKDDSQYGN